MSKCFLDSRLISYMWHPVQVFLKSGGMQAPTSGVLRDFWTSSDGSMLEIELTNEDGSGGFFATMPVDEILMIVRIREDDADGLQQE